MAREHYLERVRLLHRLLPSVLEERDFALKGGTAINLFFRDMPRLSVDIDLVFLPVADRAESLARIDQMLNRCGACGGAAAKRAISADIRRRERRDAPARQARRSGC